MGRNIPHRISEIKEIFNDIKENINAQKKVKPKNSVLLEICAPENCKHDKCERSAKNREMELLSKIEELEATITALKEKFLSKTLSPGRSSSVQTCVYDRAIDDEEHLKKQKQEVCTMREELSRMMTMSDVLRRDNVEMESAMTGYKDEISKLKDVEDVCKRQQEAICKLKDEIIDLKGTVRVFCRIRPSVEDKPVADIVFSDDLLEVRNGNKKNCFLFSRVFGSSTSQARVYEEIHALVRSALDGYKVCIFAYGQTGSGKTYTMEGVSGDEGIVPRIVMDIYAMEDAIRNNGWSFENTCTYVEVYNEEVIDLFSEKVKKMVVLHNDHGMNFSNCTVTSVFDVKDALETFQNAVRKRKTGSTECNLRSSRSHTIYTFRMEMHNESLGQKKEGVISLIDLAGSERLSVSKAEGERLKETQNINKSLSALGDVFNAILRKDNHIPFRNSKLTHLLQSQLSGHFRMAMFVNISPNVDHLGETMCSLRFAEKVGQCKLGAGRRHISTVLR